MQELIRNQFIIKIHIRARHKGIYTTIWVCVEKYFIIIQSHIGGGKTLGSAEADASNDISALNTDLGCPLKVQLPISLCQMYRCCGAWIKIALLVFSCRAFL